MKTTFLFFFLALAFSAPAFAMKKPICTPNEIRIASKLARAHSDNDKNMHCTVSCMLTLRCYSSTVLTLGYLKELKDFFTPGNPEFQDIVADMLGIQLVLQKRAFNDRECFQQCDLYYPRKLNH